MTETIPAAWRGVEWLLSPKKSSCGFWSDTSRWSLRVHQEGSHWALQGAHWCANLSVWLTKVREGSEVYGYRRLIGLRSSAPSLYEPVCTNFYVFFLLFFFHHLTKRENGKHVNISWKSPRVLPRLCVHVHASVLRGGLAAVWPLRRERLGVVGSTPSGSTRGLFKALWIRVFTDISTQTHWNRQTGIDTV